MIEFVYPWVILLLPLPLLVRLMRPYRRYMPHIRAPLYQQLISISRQRQQRAAWVHRRSPTQVVLLVLSWLLVLVALARPQWIEAPVAINKQSRDLLVLVDISGSMNEVDGGQTTRLDRLVSHLETFADNRPGDRLGLIVFGDRPYLQAPITADNEAWRTLLLATRVGPAGQNTALGDAIGLGLKHLAGSDGEEKVMLLLTDGSDNRSLVPPREAAMVAAHRGVRIFTVAIGEHSDSADVDTSTLQAIAAITGGAFYDARSTTAIQSLVEDFSSSVPSELTVEWYYPSSDLYHYPILILYLSTLLNAAFSLHLQWRRGRL